MPCPHGFTWPESFDCPQCKPSFTTAETPVDIPSMFREEGKKEQAARVKELEEENHALAAWQCPFQDGKKGLTGDEHGNQFCAMKTALHTIVEMFEYGNPPTDIEAVAKAALEPK